MVQMQDVETTLFTIPLSELTRKINFSRRLGCVWELIVQRYQDSELTLEETAAHCGISQSHLNALLDERIGLSFHQLLTRYRLLKAVQMMTEKDYTMLEIALENGFDNPSNLSRHLRRAFSVSPRQFRRQILQ